LIGGGGTGARHAGWRDCDCEGGGAMRGARGGRAANSTQSQVSPDAAAQRQLCAACAWLWPALSGRPSKTPCKGAPCSVAAHVAKLAVREQRHHQCVDAGQQVSPLSRLRATGLQSGAQEGRKRSREAAKNSVGNHAMAGGNQHSLFRLWQQGLAARLTARSAPASSSLSRACRPEAARPCDHRAHQCGVEDLLQGRVDSASISRAHTARGHGASHRVKQL
jgi:hypothetical protein